MKRAAICAVLLLSVAAEALANRVYYVRPEGNNAFNGRSPNSAWQTIGKANATVEAGPDSHVVVIVYPGSYAHAPNPENPASGGKRYHFYGNVATRGAKNGPTIPTLNLTSSYVSVRGFNCSGTLDIESPASRDTVADCTFAKGFYLDGADYNVIARSSFRGTDFWIGRNAPAGDRVTSDNLVTECDFLGLKTGSSNAVMTGLSSAVGSANNLHVDSLRVIGNRFTIEVEPNTTTAPRVHYLTRRSTFRNNHWTVQNRFELGANRGALIVRDSSQLNVFAKDTIIAHGSGYTTASFSEFGTLGCAYQSTIDSCYISVANGYPALFDCASQGDKIRRNVLVSPGRAALWFKGGFKGGTLIEHNTLASGNEYANPLEFGVAALGQGPFLGDTTKFYSNLIHFFGDYRDRRGITESRIFGLGVSIAQHPFLGALHSQWNAYSVGPHINAPGDRSIGWYDNDFIPSKPGSGERWENAFPTMDSLSRFGPAQFNKGGPDSVFCVDPSSGCRYFDPEIGHRSVAVGAGKSGADAGAIPYNPAQGFLSGGQASVSFINEVGITDTAFVVLCSQAGSGPIEFDNLTTSSTRATPSFSTTLIEAGECATLQIVYTSDRSGPLEDLVTFTTSSINVPVGTVRIFYATPRPPGGPQIIGE